MNPRKILHIGAWGRNMGDRAILDSMHSNLEAEAAERGLEIEWTLADLQEETFEDYDFAPYDLVIIGAGGLLWDKPELESPTGWQWRIPAEKILEIDPPLVLYGLGFTKFPYHDPTGSPGMWSHLRIASSKARLTSVRNKATRNILRQEGIAPDHIPDPALTLGAGSVPPPVVRHGGARLFGLCWASDKPSWRFGNQIRYDAALEGFARALRDELKPDDTVLMVEHIAGIDAEAREVFRTFLGNRFLSFEEMGGLDHDVREFFSIYESCDAVLSARKHGVWIPAGRRVPVVGIPGGVAEVGWTVSSVNLGYGFSIQEGDEVSPGYISRCIDLAMERGRMVYNRALPPLLTSLRNFDRKVVDLL